MAIPELPLGELLPGWKPPAFPPREPMTGQWCRLEPLDSAHAADLHAANAVDAAGKMWTYLPYGPFAGWDAYRAWVEDMARRTDPQLFAIIERRTGKPTGITGFLRIDPPNGCIEIGHLAYAPVLQRTAAATEAIYLLLERAFALGNRRVEWKCHALNRPSRVAAQRYGFSYEGLFRQAVVVKGRNRDTAWYSMLDREWPHVGAAFRRWLDPANFDGDGRQRSRLAELTRPGLATRDPVLEAASTGEGPAS
jgi:RimJ/RimL family protein N-acetyltransferase